MSGHSKWSTIKRQKAAGDLKRGQIFTKLGRAITIAVRESGGVVEPEKNFRLREALEKAREANMPGENVKRAIARGAGKVEGGDLNLEEVLYEGYGPFGVALLIEAVTDNKQRTASGIKHLLQSAGGHLAAPGSVSYLFSRQGLVVINKGGLSEEEILEKAVESGASDLETAGGEFEIYTEVEKLHKVKEELKQAGLKIIESGLAFRPKSALPITDKNKAEKILKLMDSLENVDDVQRVFANFDIPKRILEEIKIR